MVHAGHFQQQEILRDSGKSKKANWSPLVNKVRYKSFKKIDYFIEPHFIWL